MTGEGALQNTGKCCYQNIPCATHLVKILTKEKKRGGGKKKKRGAPELLPLWAKDKDRHTDGVLLALRH